MGGILANSCYPAQFIYENLTIQSNIIHGSYLAGVEQLLFLGSSCVYPKGINRPIREEDLLTGRIEPTNEPYAIAKIAGLKLVEAYRRQYRRHWISAMPSNLYGPRDNFDLKTAHVLPTFINRFHKAKVNHLNKVEVWGDGTPLREFLYVDDLAKACMILLESYDDLEAINVGSGQEISIENLAILVSKIIGFEGEITFDSARPNGTPRKILDSSHISELGWKAQISLEDGIASTYDWFLLSQKKGLYL